MLGGCRGPGPPLLMKICDIEMMRTSTIESWNDLFVCTEESSEWWSLFCRLKSSWFFCNILVMNTSSMTKHETQILNIEISLICMHKFVGRGKIWIIENLRKTFLFCSLYKQDCYYKDASPLKALNWLSHFCIEPDKELLLPCSPTHKKPATHSNQEVII